MSDYIAAWQKAMKVRLEEHLQRKEFVQELRLLGDCDSHPHEWLDFLASHQIHRSAIPALIHWLDTDELSISKILPPTPHIFDGTTNTFDGRPATNIPWFRLSGPSTVSIILNNEANLSHTVAFITEKWSEIDSALKRSSLTEKPHARSELTRKYKEGIYELWLQGMKPSEIAMRYDTLPQVIYGIIYREKKLRSRSKS